VTKTLDLGYRPRDWQRICHLERKRFTVLALHRRAGKTELAIRELVDKALRCSLPLGNFLYVAPYLKQAKAIAWSRLKTCVAPLVAVGRAEVSEVELTVRFPHNGAQIRIFGADNPDAMRGMRIDGVVIDEVAQIKPEVWIDILQPALSDRKGWALFIGTPQGVNLFSELYYRAQTLPEWHAKLFTVYDTDALDRDEVERLKRDMSDTSFAREYLCDFTAAGEDQLISLALVEEAARREYKADAYMHAPRILGVDVARFGDDRSVIFPRQGLAARAPIVMRGLDNMQVAARVAQEIDEWHPDATFVDVGMGAGVIDRLRQLGYEVIAVDFGSRATNAARFVNKRAEMWFDLRDALDAGLAIPNIVALKQELATPTYWFDGAQRVVLEPKDEIKKRLLGASPDLADALALTYAMPVVPKRVKADPTRVRTLERQKHGHDPYALMEPR